MTRCHVLTPRPDLQRQIRRFGDHTMDLGIVLTHPAAVQPVFKRRREHPMDLRTVMIRVPDVRSRFRRSASTQCTYLVPAQPKSPEELHTHKFPPFSTPALPAFAYKSARVAIDYHEV